MLWIWCHCYVCSLFLNRCSMRHSERNKTKTSTHLCYTVYSFLTIYSLFWSNRFTIPYLLIFVFLFLYVINGFEDGWKKWIHAKRTRKGFISADSLSFSCATQISIDVCIPYLYELEGGEHRPREIPLRFKFVPSKFRREIGRGVSFLR